MSFDSRHFWPYPRPVDVGRWSWKARKVEESINNCAIGAWILLNSAIRRVGDEDHQNSHASICCDEKQRSVGRFLGGYVQHFDHHLAEQLRISCPTCWYECHSNRCHTHRPIGQLCRRCYNANLGLYLVSSEKNQRIRSFRQLRDVHRYGLIRALQR